MPNTIPCNRGCVVLVPFPFSNQASSKVRPAVVVSPRHSSGDVLVVALTSVAAALQPGEFPIQLWREAGLLHPSFAKRAVATIEHGLLRKHLGSLRESDLLKLDDAIRFWFGLV